MRKANFILPLFLLAIPVIKGSQDAEVEIKKPQSAAESMETTGLLYAYAFFDKEHSEISFPMVFNNRALSFSYTIAIESHRRTVIPGAPVHISQTVIGEVYHIPKERGVFSFTLSIPYDFRPPTGTQYYNILVTEEIAVQPRIRRAEVANSKTETRIVAIFSDSLCFYANNPEIKSENPGKFHVSSEVGSYNYQRDPMISIDYTHREANARIITEQIDLNGLLDIELGISELGLDISEYLLDYSLHIPLVCEGELLIDDVNDLFPNLAISADGRRYLPFSSVRDSLFPQLVFSELLNVDGATYQIEQSAGPNTFLSPILHLPRHQASLFDGYILTFRFTNFGLFHTAFEFTVIATVRGKTFGICGLDAFCMSTSYSDSSKIPYEEKIEVIL